MWHLNWVKHSSKTLPSAWSFFPPKQNNSWYFMHKLGLQLCSILIEHKQRCLKSLHWTMTALHSIGMFILPVRGPLFMDNWRAQIIIPLKWKICFYYLQSFAMPLCTLTLPSDCLFIITVILLSQWGFGQFLKVPSLFQPFPVCDIIVYTLKTQWSVSCLQPGWHTLHAMKVKHKVHTFSLCPLDSFDPGNNQMANAKIVMSFLRISVSFAVIKWWPVVVQIWSWHP